MKMTSSSYATLTTLRQTTTNLLNQTQMPKPKVRHAQRVSLSKLIFADRKQFSTSLICLNEDHQNLSKWRRYNECIPFAVMHLLASRNSLWSNSKVNGKPFTTSSNNLVTRYNTSAENAQSKNSGPLPATLCSYLEDRKNSSIDLKIAPTTTCLPVRNSSESWYSTSSRNKVSTMKVSYPATKSGESSWQALCRRISGSNTANQARVLPDDNLTRIFHAVQSFQWYRDFLIRKSYFGKKTMSLSLLLDPIIGSPPSALTSPLVEARDDISALSDGFTRKVKLLRRRLSTSFDDPSYDNVSSAGRVVSSSIAVGSNTAVEHVGPFGFRSAGVVKKVDASSLHDDDCEDKKAKLNAWLEKLQQEASAKSEGSSDENNANKGDSQRSNSSSHDDNGEHSSKPPSSPSARISEDLFQLLEKVIECKGRSISHITIEQSVKHLCTVYMDASDDDKLKFFTILAEKYGVDHGYVQTAAANLASCQDDDVRLTLEEKLRGALVPKSQWLFTQIGRLENGVKFLVDMRVDLLDATEVSKGKSSLKALNNSLRDLIGMWFNVGFLNLERVTWQSSCDMLQKISEYEAVHPMRNWTDLKKRVGPNRRCFVFTHNSMPGEPVVVLHTFLTDHISSSVQKIVSNHRMRMMSLDSGLPLTTTTEDPDYINTAVFYSITSTQRGLTGIELGNYLIKRVVRELQSEFPKMTQFSTLSPIPGFKNWLVGSIKSAIKEPTNIGQTLLTEVEMNALRVIFEDCDKTKSFYEVFLDVLKLNSWFSNEKLVKELEKPLMRLCAQYLYLVKRRGYALDPVANFHLKNGAVIWRINWLGDDSPRGLGQSCGMMVNYRYFLETCESNSQNYMENQVIQISDQVKHFIKVTGGS